MGLRLDDVRSGQVLARSLVVGNPEEMLLSKLVEARTLSIASAQSISGPYMYCPERTIVLVCFKS